MNPAISNMLARTSRTTQADHENALKEILQEISLLGLWRAKFFENAAFYGGTALRIHFGLDRFSEDLDFSLLEVGLETDFAPYFEAVRTELAAFGFNATVQARTKNEPSPISAGMIRTGLRDSLLQIEVPDSIVAAIPVNQVIRIRLEIDTDPPPGFETEMHSLLQPIPFFVRTYTLPCLFASKVHAVLCRKWRSRVKGRDWYDLVWYCGRSARLSLEHLRQRMIQSGDWSSNESLSAIDLRKRLEEAIAELDVEAARRDVSPFLDHPAATEVWSREFFREIAARIQTVD